MGLPGGACIALLARSLTEMQAEEFATRVYDTTFPKGISQKKKETLHLQAIRTVVFPRS